jgi:serine/threonine protein kinase
MNEKYFIAGKYELIKKISEGSFGVVFQGKNIRTQEPVAVKVELKKNIAKTLKMEAKIYQLLKGEYGFPHLKWYGTNENINYLMIDLLGPSLESISGKCKFNEAILICIQIIERLKTLHEKFLIHRDIKPCNFLFGLNNKTIHLIDMGFCKRYDVDGKHMEPRILSHPIGTPNYVGINVHNNIEPSRRDDLESCVYVFVYLLNGMVSWEQMPFGKEMAQQKSQYLTGTTIPEFLFKMMSHIRHLKFDESPNYNFLIGILKTQLNCKNA